MVRSAEGAAESSTGLTISHKRIGEEQARLCRKPVGDLTSLTHEAILHLHGIINRATITDNRILTDHACSDKHWSVHRTHHGTLRQSRGATDFAVTLDDCIGNIFRVDDFHVVTDSSPFRSRHPQLIFYHLLQPLLQASVTVVFHHQRSQLRVQLPEDRHVTVAHLVQHRNHRSLTIGGVVRRL